MRDDTPPEEMRSLIGDVEARSGQRPGNLHYVALLARYYMGLGDYARAAQSYGALAEAVPEDAQALAYAAQAEYLAAGRSLSDRARLRAEQALVADPHQRTALGLLGMASFEQAQYRAERVGNRFSDLMQENPLMIGAAAAALGAIVGFAFPATEKENEIMGEARDRVVDRAQEVASETAQKVQHVAQEAATAAKETAKDEAQKQNLAGGSNR
jgi:hypothetical protein